MEWLMLPFDKHSDDGFGAMADSFKDSANILIKHPEENFLGIELSACYLLRHACELYLKSLLIVTHRYLLQRKKETRPEITVNGKKKPLTSVHSLKILYEELSAILNGHSERLNKLCRTSWLPLPPELTDAINAIDALDDSSFFFRYPNTKDKQQNDFKSKNKKIETEEILNWDQESKGYIKAFLLVDENGNINEAFNYEKEIFQNELKNLKIACDWLICFHVGLRVELAGGR